MIITELKKIAGTWTYILKNWKLLFIDILPKTLAIDPPFLPKAF